MPGSKPITFMPSDSAQTDDTEGTPRQLEAGVVFLARFHRLADLGVAAGELLRELPRRTDVTRRQQHAGDHQFLHGIGVRARGVEHWDAELAELVHRNIVHARAGTPDRLERLRNLHVMHLEGTQQDTIRLLQVGGYLELVGRQLGEPERRDIVEREYLVHDGQPFFCMKSCM
jgi:hypothetical protein